MAYWEAYFTTSGDLPTAGCPADERQWSSVHVPALVTPGADPMHPPAVGQRIHRLIAGSEYRDPVVTLDEWDRVFNVLPYPKVSNLQGERIAPVWRAFIAKHEARA
jgi:hypothetical protein